MNIKIKTAILALSLWLTSGALTSASADCSGYACTDVTIDEIYISNYVYIRTSGDPSLLTCAPIGTSGAYLRFDHQTHVAAKEIYAMLLNLLVSQKPVKKLVFSTIQTDCTLSVIVDTPA